MERVFPSAVAALVATLSLAGCGSGTGASEPAPNAAEPVAGVSVPIETTDGRLGGATTVRTGSRPRALSTGGPLDARRHGKHPRRDGVGAGAGCANADLAPSAAALPAATAATLCLVNGARADNGLAALAPNAKLAATASAYARDLVAGSYFSHDGRDGSSSFDRIKRGGYIPSGAGYVLGENLAWGTGALATPRSIMQAWMNSAGHRQNVLNKDFREFGMGIAVGNPAARNGLGATYANTFGVLQGGSTATQPAARRSAAQRRRARQARARHARRVKARAASRAKARASRARMRAAAGNAR
jgi:uncharacterized protein YkwD